MTGLLVLLETEPDPNVVQPGIIPLIMLVVLAGIVVLLYRSMRSQLRKVRENQLPHERKPDAAPDVDIRRPAP